jgi:hypothetical protein
MFNEMFGDSFYISWKSSEFWTFENLKSYINIIRTSKNYNSILTLDNIKNNFERLLEILYKYEFPEDYLRDYLELNSIIELYQIYTLFHPYERLINIKSNKYEESQKIYNSIIKENPKRLFESCKRLAEIIRLELKNNKIIDYVIHRFQIYMEVFFELIPENLGKRPEDYFQKEMEQFLFYNHVFPINQAKLGNSKIDILAMENRDSIFLYELKQIGFTSNNKISPSLVTKHIIQLKDYVKKYSLLPVFMKRVYLIYFSKEPFELYPKNYMEDGITYNLIVIDLSKTDSSKMNSNIISLNIEKIRTGSEL